MGVNPEKERIKEPFGLYIIEMVCREEDLSTTVLWIYGFIKLAVVSPDFPPPSW